jgi:hypothetical protein
MAHPARPRNQAPDHLSTDRSAADEHELVRPALNSDIFDGEERQRRQQEEVAGGEMQEVDYSRISILREASSGFPYPPLNIC